MEIFSFLVGNYKSAFIESMDLCLCAWCIAIFETLHEHKFSPGPDSRMKAHIFSPEIAPSVYFVTETENHNTNNKPLALFYNHMFHPRQRRGHTIPPLQLSLFLVFLLL